MKKHPETIYKIILTFSVLINLFLIILLAFVIRDSLSGRGEWHLEGKSFWYFISVILAYSLANSTFIVRFLKIKSIKE